jgi:hypothetical protein
MGAGHFTEDGKRGLLSHDQARSRAFRWGDDGMAGICDDHGMLCFGWRYGEANIQS